MLVWVIAGTILFVAVMVVVNVAACKWMGSDKDDGKWIGQ